MHEITVLMPVYNAEQHLHEAVESILGQTFPDLELLIVDDGCTDSSVAILERFDDPRIRLVRSRQRLRLSGALNLGMAEAKGRFIARMDADDISRPRRLERQLAFMQAHPELGLCGTWVRRFGAGPEQVERYPTGYDRVKAHALFNTPFAHPSVMLRRELFVKHGLAYCAEYYPTEDYELWSRALDLFACDNLPEVLLDYRVHGASLTGADWGEMDRQAARVSDGRMQALGVEMTGEQSRFHRDLAMGRLAATRETVTSAETWLQAMIERNRERRTYDADGLAAAAAELWLKTCMQASELGWWVARCYMSSPLSKPKRLTGTVLCLASVARGHIR